MKIIKKALDPHNLMNPVRHHNIREHNMLLTQSRAKSLTCERETGSLRAAFFTRELDDRFCSYSSTRHALMDNERMGGVLQDWLTLFFFSRIELPRTVVKRK